MIAGVNVCKTRQGERLYDGGCTILRDGEIAVSIAEERITREKYAGGFEHALPYCLDAVGAELEDLDYVVGSNCCDAPLTREYLRERLIESGFDVPTEKIVVNPSHHLSHACSAYFTSPFDEAIVLVVDNEGNVLEGENDDYRRNRLERTSAYVARDADVELLERHHDGYDELGIGAAYKYVTHYLGFDSYKDAGKVMGLSSYGDGELSDYRFFDDEGNCLIENRPEDKSGAVRDCLREQGYDPGKPKTDTTSPSDVQAEIAWLVQRETEREILELIGSLVDRTGITNLCYAGGVALNCVLNDQILERTDVDRLVIPPAAGDAGQCLGNALYGHHCHLGRNSRPELTTAYLGRRYRDRDVDQAVERFSQEIAVHRPENVESAVASALATGDVVGLFRGSSEFGPRALGNRSILADPRRIESRDAVNESVKFREQWRPFAPAVLAERQREYFGGDRSNGPSEFMLLAPEVLEEKREEIPAVTHVDGTSRLQAVYREHNPTFHEIIRNFADRTGVPVLLNTSFNLSGEPIVETPRDALRCFLRSGLDCVVIGDRIVREPDA